jgi:ornithine carbamoyltransferase
MNTHFITLADFSKSEIMQFLTRAMELKGSLKRGQRITPLSGKILGLLFEKPSLRTRVTFEVGMRQLGGDSLYMAASDVQLGVRESVSDVARNLERYLDGIVLRTYRHEVVEELARFSSIPVINGLTDLLHPCQILSDMLTVFEKKERIKGIRISYVGDGNNVANSWLLGASIMGIHLAVACPKGYEPDAGIIRKARGQAKVSGAKIVITHDPKEAVKRAEIIYTDVWTSMGKERESAKRRIHFQGFQVNQELVSLAGREVLIMHCLPAHRGEEITDEVLDGPHSIVFDQAENRLHAQKAILEAFLGEKAKGERIKKAKGKK